jgi:hypothetical protein
MKTEIKLIKEGCERTFEINRLALKKIKQLEKISCSGRKIKGFYITSYTYNETGIINLTLKR